MKPRHISLRVRMALLLASHSQCVRRQHGAQIIDPKRNTVISDGYNGSSRGGGPLCGGAVCTRDELRIPSGTRTEIGCHHAEENALCNAAADGRATAGAWMICTGEPCPSCARLIHHSGIARVVVVKGGHPGANGVAYLRDHGVEVEMWEGR